MTALINFDEFRAKRQSQQATLSKARRDVSDKAAMLECAALIVNYPCMGDRLWMIEQLHKDNHITENEIPLLETFVRRVEELRG